MFQSKLFPWIRSKSLKKRNCRFREKTLFESVPECNILLAIKIPQEQMLPPLPFPWNIQVWTEFKKRKRTKKFLIPGFWTRRNKSNIYVTVIFPENGETRAKVRLCAWFVLISIFPPLFFQTTICPWNDYLRGLISRIISEESLYLHYCLIKVKK